MSERSSLFGDWNEQGGSFYASLMGFSRSSSYQAGGQDASARTYQSSAVLPSYTRFYTPQHGSHTSSIAYTKSTSSRRIAYTTLDEWARGVTPCLPAWREPGPPLSSASSLNDPILRSFASHTPSGSSASPANSAIGQTAGPNTPSISTDATDSDKSDSDEEEHDFGEGDDELRTPDTSDASVSDIIFVFDQVDADQAAVIPSRELLIDLQLPAEPLKPPPFSDNDDNSNIDGIPKFLRERPTNSQPYTAGTEGLWKLDYNGATLAPSLDFAYKEYYLSTREHAEGQLNVSLRGRSGYSPQILASIFHPRFLVSHLSPVAVSTFATDLYAPHGFAYHTEYSIDLSFHFGPPLGLEVCTFIPRDTKSLRSYQKHLDKDYLDVEDSLPIALNLLSLDLQVEDLNTWLEGIVGCESSLTEYGELMQRRQKGQQSPQILRAVISWYLESKNKLSEQADQILRIALKLLITTTLLAVVPKVIHPPEKLLNYLSSHYPQPAIPISFNAPKLLNRQIKASVFRLQEILLQALFSRFSYAKMLPAEVKVAVAILVAFVLDLLRHMGREFAKYSQKINSTVSVKEQEVMQYEVTVQTQLFERVRASILTTVEKTGRLGEQLRDLGSRVKGKEKETQPSEFVSAIMDNVYKE